MFKTMKTMEKGKQFKNMPPSEVAHYKHLARKMYSEGNDDINVDDDAKLSEGSDGVWVQAWVWVPR